MESPRSPSPKRVRRRLPLDCGGSQKEDTRPLGVTAGPCLQQQVFLRRLEIEGFKTFCERESVDICPGWGLEDTAESSPSTAMPVCGRGPLAPAESPSAMPVCERAPLAAPSPLTVIFGGNGAGKSAIFDAVLFVLGQTSKSMRSSGGFTQLVNDQTVQRKGSSAAATVVITFQKTCQKSNSCKGVDAVEMADVLLEDRETLSSGKSVQNLSVGRSVKHTKGTSTYTVQGKSISRAGMMKALSEFVGADMSDVDRYVLKQGSTMVCLREGKELLSFIERLAGTTELKTMSEEAHTALDDLREEVLSLEVESTDFRHRRKQLQPQVDALFAYQKDAAGLREEKIGLWHREMAWLRVQLNVMEATAEDNKGQVAKLEETIKASKAQNKCARRELAQATKGAEEGSRSLGAARAIVQKARADQAETDARARKTTMAARSKSAALTRARKLRKEGDEEIAKLKAQGSKIDAVTESMKARISELESEPGLSAKDVAGFGRREKILRQLSSLETGPLADLEKASTERKNLLAKASTILEKLVATGSDTRSEMKRREEAVEGSKQALEAAWGRVTQIDAEAAKTRAHYAAQQARVGSLEAWCTHEGTATGRHSRPTVAARSNNNSRISAMRSLVKNLREEGVCVHGLLADLVLLRRECDRKAVAAVIGPALWTAVVVQARRDGARVVAAARAAGITGKIRCDVLDEMKKTMPMATSAGPANGGSGLITLSECVATADPLHFPAAVKYLRGWLLAQTRQEAWGVRTGASKHGAPNVVSASGELFYASGEVAVKAPHTSASSQAPRLGLLQTDTQRDGAQVQQALNPVDDQPETVTDKAHVKGEERGAQDVGKRLKEAMAAAERRVSELTREAAEARFDSEDAQARHLEAQTKAEESRRQVSAIEKKAATQRRLIQKITAEDGPAKKSFTPTTHFSSETELEKLLLRKEKLLAESAKTGEPGPSGGNDGGQEKLSAQAAAMRELRDLKTDAEAKRELRNEVKMKLRILTKREQTREERVLALTAETKNLKSEDKSLKARQAQLGDNMASLMVGLEEAVSVNRSKRDAERDADGTAREAKRNLFTLNNQRVELQKRHSSLEAGRRKARMEANKIAQCLLDTKRTDSASPPEVAALTESRDVGDNDDAQEEARLVRELELFQHGSTSGPEEAANNLYQNDGRGGGCDGDSGGGRYEENEPALKQGVDPTCAGDESALKQGVDLSCAVVEEDEVKVAKLVGLLQENNAEKKFLETTGTVKASIRLKKAKLQKRHEAVDAAAVSRAVRLDREAVELQTELESMQESVIALMDKKEALETARHTTLVKCLEEVNGALGAIYRRLTSVEDATSTSAFSTNIKDVEKLGVNGPPGGDSFLRFSRERTLLLSEGISVRTKPDPGSPWRGPGSLSGGQAALVGLALNLATQVVRPAPLHLMDEIDAALDIHKVRRVASMLADRASSGYGQCIVISHRPEMQERGSTTFDMTTELVHQYLCRMYRMKNRQGHLGEPDYAYVRSAQVKFRYIDKMTGLSVDTVTASANAVTGKTSFVGIEKNQPHTETCSERLPLRSEMSKVSPFFQRKRGENGPA